jgi:hypothetical protein
LLIAQLTFSLPLPAPARGVFEPKTKETLPFWPKGDGACLTEALGESTPVVKFMVVEWR